MYYPYGSAVGPFYGARARDRDDPLPRRLRDSRDPPVLPPPRRSAGPVGVVGPFGGVGVVGYTPAVSFGGASRFFPAGYRGGVYGGGVARRGFYRGGRRYLREVDERSFPLATSPALAPFPALAPSPAAEDDADDACRTMWEVIASRDDLSYLRRLLERDLPRWPPPSTLATPPRSSRDDQTNPRPTGTRTTATIRAWFPSETQTREGTTSTRCSRPRTTPSGRSTDTSDKRERPTPRREIPRRTRTRRTLTRFECSAPGTSPRRRISSRTTSFPTVVFECPTSRWTNC